MRENRCRIEVSECRGGTPPRDRVVRLVLGRPAEGSIEYRLTPEDAAALARDILRQLPAACRLVGRQVPHLAVCEIHPPAVEPPLESVL